MLKLVLEGEVLWKKGLCYFILELHFSSVSPLHNNYNNLEFYFYYIYTYINYMLIFIK